MELDFFFFLKTIFTHDLIDVILGRNMSLAAREFTEDPCSSSKRCNMIRIAQNLLSSVIRLLILADKADVNALLLSVKDVQS